MIGIDCGYTRVFAGNDLAAPAHLAGKGLRKPLMWLRCYPQLPAYTRKYAVAVFVWMIQTGPRLRYNRTSTRAHARAL